MYRTIEGGGYDEVLSSKIEILGNIHNHETRGGHLFYLNLIGKSQRHTYILAVFGSGTYFLIISIRVAHLYSPLRKD